MAILMVDGRHGRFVCQDNDAYVGRSLALYGEYSEGEVELMRAFVPAGGTVVEAGANIGALTVPLALLAGANGRVFAFEPQRLIYHMLCGNLALNGIENCFAFNMAVADQSGQIRVPVTPYGREANYGGIVAGGGDAGEAVPVGTIDALKLDHVDLIKADVEGAEEFVLRGAEATIRRSWPALYLENDRKEHSKAILGFLLGMGYRIWWHAPPMFNPRNFFGKSENVFGTLASFNILCLHREGAHPPAVPGLHACAGADEWPL